jgi:hypothetical protein
MIFSLGVRYVRQSHYKENEPKKLTTIQINNKKVNLGKVLNNRETKTVFFLHNTGSENLHIENVEVSCSCSSSTASHTTIAPGDSIPITVTYNKKTLGYFYTDVIVRGNFEKSPEILSFEGYLVDQQTNH